MLPANCQKPITSASAIQPAWRPALGAKPPPRNSTGRGSASRSVGGEACVVFEGSSMLDLALGIDRFLADERPQIALQREQLAARPDVAAIGARQRNGDDLADPSGPP